MAKKPARPLGRAMVERTRGGDRILRRTTVYFEPDLFKRLRFYSVEKDTDISTVINEAVHRYLGAREK